MTIEAAFDDASAIKLFKAVIIQALNDACLVPPKALPQEMPLDFYPKKKTAKTRERVWCEKYRDNKFKIAEVIRDRDEAREWLLGDSEDFRQVCDFAQWDSDYIASGVRKLQFDGWKARKKLSLETLNKAA